MSDLDSTQCRAIIAELAAMLPSLFKAQASRRILSFGKVQDDPNRRTRWDPVFTGGSIVQFLITDPAARPASMTKDVDAVIEIASYAEFVEMEEVAAFVSKCIRNLLATTSFMDSLPYLIADAQREVLTVRQMSLIIG